MSATTPPLPPLSSLAPGDVLLGTPYRIVRKLGAGAMGEVYEATHEHLGIQRALKVLAPQHAQRPDMIERMRIEARSLARITHENLVAVQDLGLSDDGRWFFAMERLEGATLRDELRAKGRLAPREAVAIARAVLRGLHAAHASGLVHRDVKPENVFVTQSGVKVLDFGIAKLAELNGERLTATGFTIGTPRYMAPEQITGKDVDARTDIYAVGVMLYEMLAGRVPFEQTDPMALAYAHTTKPPPDITRSLGIALPSRLGAAVMRALAKRADARFSDARAFEDELRGCEDDGLPTDVTVATAEDASALRGAETRTATALVTPALRVRTAGSAFVVLGAGVALAIAWSARPTAQTVTPAEAGAAVVVQPAAAPTASPSAHAPEGPAGVAEPRDGGPTDGGRPVRRPSSKSAPAPSASVGVVRDTSEFH